MSDELKPCPFCGKSARIWQDPSHSAAFFIGCDDGETDCFGAIMWAESKPETIAAWNRRADLAQAPAPVRVKPLAWRDDGQGGFIAKGVARTYNVHRLALEPGQWGAVGVSDTAPNYSAVKDACDRDNAARILAALEAPDAGVVAELVEAAKAALNFITNTESELGIELDSGNKLRAIIAKLETRA